MKRINIILMGFGNVGPANGKFIWGILNLDEENLRIKYLSLVDELLNTYSAEDIRNSSKSEKRVSIKGVDIARRIDELKTAYV